MTGPAVFGQPLSARSTSRRSPLHVELARASSQAPTDAYCRATLGMPCYSPQEIRHAYGVDQLVNKGDDGAGETIVIVDSYGSPTIASDLATFDAGYGLPARPSFTIFVAAGHGAVRPHRHPRPDRLGR